VSLKSAYNKITLSFVRKAAVKRLAATLPCYGVNHWKGTCLKLEMKRHVAIVLVLANLNLSACSFLPPHNQMINIIPSDPNATVFVDHKRVGDGSQSIMLSKSRIHSVTAKCGNSTGTAIVYRTLSITAYLDFAGSLFILPLVGLLAPGSHRLTPSTIRVEIPDESACELAS